MILSFFQIITKTLWFLFLKISMWKYSDYNVRNGTLEVDGTIDYNREL